MSWSTVRKGAANCVSDVGLPFKKVEDTGSPLTCDGERSARRDDELVQQTREVAEEVRRTGRAKRLAPMNAYERRLVHLTVREFERLGSRSEGNGHLKRVKVFRQGDA